MGPRPGTRAVQRAAQAVVARTEQLVEPQVEPQVVLKEQPEVKLEAERGAAPKVVPRELPRVELEEEPLVRAVPAAKARARPLVDPQKVRVTRWRAARRGLRARSSFRSPSCRGHWAFV